MSIEYSQNGEKIKIHTKKHKTLTILYTIRRF